MFLVFEPYFCDRADPAAALLLPPVASLNSIFDADEAALNEVVLPAMIVAPKPNNNDSNARRGASPGNVAPFI